MGSNGASGAEFVDQVIKDADAIIIAADATVSERNRFDGKPIVEVQLREAIDKPGEVVERAEKAAQEDEGEESAGDQAQEEDEDEGVPTDMGGSGWAAEVWLMT